jgi:hypothetical protein
MAVSLGCKLDVHLVLHSLGHMGMCIVVQQDDAISEISHIVQGQLIAMKWKVIQTSGKPLSNVHILSPHGCTFMLHNYVQGAVVQWFRQQPK